MGWPVLLLVICVGCLCDSDVPRYDKNGFLIPESEAESSDYDEEIEVSCGKITSPPGNKYKVEKRITTDGTDAKYLEFPWVVALFAPRPQRRRCALEDSKCWFFRCGGSLISSKVALTAANCIYTYRQKWLKVRAGDWHLDTHDETLPYQESYVVESIIHELYHDSKYGNQLANDVALMIVESPYMLTSNVGFICLPPPDLNVASSSCKAAGWGVQKYGDRRQQKLLQVVDLNHVDHDDCQWKLRRYWRSSLVLHDSFTCAGGVQGKDTCQGDGGSPLMCLATDHYYLRGITSWGVGCGYRNIPGVYTDVVKMRSWIDENMAANGFQTDTYTHVSYRT